MLRKSCRFLCGSCKVLSNEREQGRARSLLAALVLSKLLLEDFKRAEVDGVGWCVPQNGWPQALEWPSYAVVCKGGSYGTCHTREGRCIIQTQPQRVSSS